eukprot:gene11709-15674_t
MCGNFGLLLLKSTSSNDQKSHNHESAGNGSGHDDRSFHRSRTNLRGNVEDEALDRSINESMHQVSQLHGIRIRDTHQRVAFSQIPEHLPPIIETQHIKLLPPIEILKSQTSCTEVRGGQAGGLSSLEYKLQHGENNSGFDAHFGVKSTLLPINYRVRCVARKRYALAADLANEYQKLRLGYHPDPSNSLTVIGHTRFATSSINTVPELHPHEWVPFHEESVWLFDRKNGLFENHTSIVGIHISHNGDFDALESTVGCWLERILHVPNNLRGDSPKIAGCMDLLRVQGRWEAAARLSWVRCILKNSTGVSGGKQLNKSAPNSFPGHDFWNIWGNFFDQGWRHHINNIIKVLETPNFETKKEFYYQIDPKAVKQFEGYLMKEVFDKQVSANDVVNAMEHRHFNLTISELVSFIHFTVRGFLHSDMYNSMTEFLSRAIGSFGLQMHCSLEPGVVVIASKGQPMSLAFDPDRPICLFGSEAEALAVPVDVKGNWLKERLDLDSHGEIIRVGEPRALIEGSFCSGKNENEWKEELQMTPEQSVRFRNVKNKSSSITFNHHHGRYAMSKSYLINYMSCLRLISGLEIRSYSLSSSTEASCTNLIDRCLAIESAPVPYDPKVDLVAADLSITPAVLAAIDRAWLNPHSMQRIAGDDLANHLMKCMKRRMKARRDTIDFLIVGVEVSLWVAEQWASDLRNVFPMLNIVTTSSNKMLGLDNNNPTKVFFPGSDEVSSSKIDDFTCALLISQSGQTFPTLHATRIIAKYVKQKLWLLTGCFNSKMEQALSEWYTSNGLKYGKNRVLNNLSGNRPAEPSSVAVAATWHTLTQALLAFANIAKKRFPANRIIRDWDYNKYANILQRFFRYVRFHRKSKSIKGKNLYFINPISIKANVKVDLTPIIVMNLTDGCIEDIKSLLVENIVPNISRIVGYDSMGNRLASNLVANTEEENLRSNPLKIHNALVEQGRAWADHINEPWNILVAVGIYITISVGLGIPIFGTCVDIIIMIVRACGVNFEEGTLTFSPRNYHAIYNQHPAWTIGGLILQICDALFFVYLAKTFAKGARILDGRPLAARLGKRTIVIVDTPCLHQLVEIFVSKLFAQSYSIVSVDVHGASGLDHFVHRFTHRVARGLLLAVGRPDGRLCCLAKAESAILLSVKQAAFIRNPSYKAEGSGPEIVTIGHNPYVPSLGLAHNIVISEESTTRRKFVDEYLYDRLFLASKPNAHGILRWLCKTAISQQKSNNIFSVELLSAHLHHAPVRNRVQDELMQYSNHSQASVDSISVRSHQRLPYGVQHIDPIVVIPSQNQPDMSLFANFVDISKDTILNLASLTGKESNGQNNRTRRRERMKQRSCDPAERLAFSTRLDADAQLIQDQLVVVQRFYECRIASLERYISFCVMFHAMAEKCSRPLLLQPWDIARSQSNLRIATTACPISLPEDENNGISKGAKNIAKFFVFTIRKVMTNF